MAKKRVKGADKLKAAFSKMPGAFETLALNEAFRSAETVRTNVIADIRVQKTSTSVGGVQLVNVNKGRRRGKRRRHMPSPPYGPPNADTGNLMGRYGTAMGRAAGKVWSTVIAGVRYARFLEFGTSRMLPRPHLLPRFNEEKVQFVKRLKESMNRVAALAWKGR